MGGGALHQDAEVELRTERSERGRSEILFWIGKSEMPMRYSLEEARKYS